jgi:hypothetical protein
MASKVKLKSKKVSKPVCLIVTSKVKGLIKEEGLRSGKDFLEALSQHVRNIIDSAIQQTKEQGRKQTLGAEDVPA